jgi:hypothetical protein
MKSKVSTAVIVALLKLDLASGERKNVTAFIQSCYGGLVCNYDFDAALESLKKLSDIEQHALIEFIAQFDR